MTFLAEMAIQADREMPSIVKFHRNWGKLTLNEIFLNKGVSKPDNGGIFLDSLQS
jgi:hypothetical protein